MTLEAHISVLVLTSQTDKSKLEEILEDKKIYY